ncbi:hypothetical protein J4573_52460 [Actinomadura barringtoniae]|uniref:DUF11 domain-containing protein n=1 Tax=Actinomadura barringtoniae TaxID=1427535 RepID=A0A939PMN3_9ACTN|nr:DUF11 domain-containing protein [Actinomadura barringtoniae]MBO2455772.1 hypothetical protein [Actinomadura barringtoniae]
MRPRGPHARIAGTAIAVAAAALVAVPQAGTAGAAAREELVSESFSGSSTTPGMWAAPSPRGSHTPCLTAATDPPAGSLKACNAVKSGRSKADPPGEGVFQLTDNSKKDAGGLVLTKPLTTKKGLRLDFDMYMYDQSTKKAADGIAFYLLDGAQKEVTAGEIGGALGYKGIKGAVMGFGFDQFGNFATKIGGATENSKFTPDNIGVRGAESTGYRYITGVKAPASLDAPDAKSRQSAKRHVSIAVSPANFLSLSMDFNDGKGSRKLIKDFDLDGIKGQPKLPDTLKLGWSASTGAYTSYHEISGFRAASLDPNLSVKLTGDLQVRAGGAGSAQLEVSNAAAAAATDGTVTATYKIAAGLKVDRASGDGWSCDVAGDLVTCKRPDVLEPGASAPPITIRYTAGGAATGLLNSIAKATTPGQAPGEDPAAKLAVQIIGQIVTPPVGKDPSVSLSITHDGDPVPGGVTPYHLTVRNDSHAGPTDGTVTATFDAPSVGTIKLARGDGWRCKVDGKRATCTRRGMGDDALKPGKTYPPVTVEVAFPDDAAGAVVEAQGKITVPGDADESDNEAVEPVTVAKPNKEARTGLKIHVDASPRQYKAEQPFTYTVTVTNDGPDLAKDAVVNVHLPDKWTKVPWACKATGGSRCPKPIVTKDKYVLPIKGNLDTTIDVAPGGKVVLQVSCKPPKGFTSPIEIMGAITPPPGAVNAGCTGTCKATLTAPKSTSWF